jgi:hypothetical protein
VKFGADDAGISRPSTPNLRTKLGSGSRPSTPTGRPPPPNHTHTHALHPKQLVQTPQQFYDWFALIDRSVAHSQESHFRAHVASVAEHLDTCDRLVESIDEIDREVEGMLEGWRGVEEGGRSLKDACERLLEERVRLVQIVGGCIMRAETWLQDRLLELTDDIGSRLEYFKELEYATRMLNHPGESLVLQTDFLYMVERVDICIDYLKSHVRPLCFLRVSPTFNTFVEIQRHYKEAEIYLLRFQQCMTRAMTLIKMYFVGSLRALTADVTRRISEKVNPFQDILTKRIILYWHYRTYPKPPRCISFIPASGALLVRSRLFLANWNVAQMHIPKNSLRCWRSAMLLILRPGKVCWLAGLLRRSKG